MLQLQDSINALNKLITTGETVKAMEQFYADDVEMQENEEPPRKGKHTCIAIEKTNLQRVKYVKSRLIHQAINTEKNIVFSEWEILCTYKNDTKSLLTQVAVQQWVEGKVSKEKFYYHSWKNVM